MMFQWKTVNFKISDVIPVINQTTFTFIHSADAFIQSDLQVGCCGQLSLQSQQG